MKLRKKSIAVILCFVLIASCLCFGLSGCFLFNKSYTVDELADMLAKSLMGNDYLNWNVFSVDPENSFGVEFGDDISWYSYSAITDEDIKDAKELFDAYKSLLKEYDVSKLSEKDKITYRSLDYTVNTYSDYYGSPYAKQFSLIGGSYINSEGGYVAEMASSVENFIFRDEDDVKGLLKIIESAEQAFETYLDFADDRLDCGYPLYDCTVISMQNYLKDVLGQGNDYYLYDFMAKKIDEASFLTAESKQSYKNEYSEAISDSFMKGVKTLSDGLENFKGYVEITEESYLAAFGDAGRAYYKWRFESLTGIRNANISKVYDELYDAYVLYANACRKVLAEVEGKKESDKAFYDGFYAYYNGEKGIFNSKNPVDMLAYLKNLSEKIVPPLNATPEIDFKYIDETVADITNTLAYYVVSPLDDLNSAEHITINPNALKGDMTDLLTTIGHEGYPGHLYAHVKAKESGLNLLTLIDRCTAFSEGWAKYVELSILDIIGGESEDKALKAYCEYYRNYILFAFISNVLDDMNVNYFGKTVSEYVSDGVAETTATAIIEAYMEIPAAYLPYGYGMYVVENLHNDAKVSLGDKYDEVEFNGKLLSEGFGPTFIRAGEITEEYINSK